MTKNAQPKKHGKVAELAQKLNIPLGTPINIDTTHSVKREVISLTETTQVKEDSDTQNLTRPLAFRKPGGLPGRRLPSRRNRTKPAISDTPSQELKDSARDSKHSVSPNSTERFNDISLTSNLSSRSIFTDLSNNPKKRFLIQLLNALEKKENWDIKWGGGTSLVVNGKNIVMPAHAANMYLAFDATWQNKIDETFDTVSGILKEAQHGNANDNFFTWLYKLLKYALTRSNDTQSFYNEQELESNALNL